MSEINPEFLILRENLEKGNLEIINDDEDILEIEPDNLDMIGKVFKTRQDATKASDPRNKVNFIDEDLENLIFAEPSSDELEKGPYVIEEEDSEEFDPEYRAPEESYLVIEETFA